jgi:hypothetical protein
MRAMMVEQLGLAMMEPWLHTQAQRQTLSNEANAVGSAAQNPADVLHSLRPTDLANGAVCHVLWVHLWDDQWDTLSHTEGTAVVNNLHQGWYSHVQNMNLPCRGTLGHRPGMCLLAFMMWWCSPPTTAPAAAAAGPRVLLMEPPALNRAMSTFLKLQVPTGRQILAE